MPGIYLTLAIGYFECVCLEKALLDRKSGVPTVSEGLVREYRARAVEGRRRDDGRGSLQQAWQR